MAPCTESTPAQAGPAGSRANAMKEVPASPLRRASLRPAALRRDVARQAKANSEGLKQRLLELEQELKVARDDKKDIYEEMIRQYQALQQQTETRIQQLETETKRLQQELASCHQDIQQAQEDREQLLGDKDQTIAELQGKIEAMETEYEKILHVSHQTREHACRWAEAGKISLALEKSAIPALQTWGGGALSPPRGRVDPCWHLLYGY
uniref:Dynein regulatory complex protein 12 n=1 Tax=Pelusios castaneus TaxID=367368 RepID=A0A8C8RQP0_9SAUR